MRTTIEIDDEFLKAGNKNAAERGVPLRRIVQESLAQTLKQRARQQRRKPRLRWKVTKGPAVRGEDFADPDRLYKLMEERDL